MSHTPEPWFYSKSKHGIDGGHDVIASIENGNEDMSLLIHAEGEDFNGEENARRIVACVNKFEGLPTDQIESMPVNVLRMTEFIDALNVSRDTYRDLCAELLNVLKMTYEYHAPGYHDCTDNGLPECEWCESKKAITKAEKILNPEQPK